MTRRGSLHIGRIVCLAVLVSCLVLFPDQGLSAGKSLYDHPYPLHYRSLVDGERLEYQAGWNGIPVARATVTTDRDPDKGPFFVVSAEARTMGYTSLVWNMHDTLASHIDARSYYPESFVVRFDENRKVDLRRAVFSYPENLIRVVRQKRQKIQEYSMPINNTYDGLTAAFLLRSIPLKVGDAPQTEVSDGKDIYLIRMDVEAEEPVAISIGTIPAFRMKVSLKKVYPPEDEPPKKKKFHWATVWMSSDSARVPLRMESKVFIGHVYVELTSENRGLTQRFAPP